jgi:gas vesicle protein
LDITDNNISKVGYLVGGFSVGSLIGIFFAPKSGDETREYLTNKAKQIHEFAEDQARYFKDRAEGLLEHGIDRLAAKGKEIATAVSIGRDAYHSECELAEKEK